jgi:hypothetical protein
MTWRHESAFTCLRKPLSESPLALETTAGIHVRGAAPFTAGDQSFRAVPAESVADRPEPREHRQRGPHRGGSDGRRATRFRGLVRLLESYAEGRDIHVPERNKEVLLPPFVRWVTDDLKAFYLEARMQQKPGAYLPGAEGLVIRSPPSAGPKLEDDVEIGWGEAPMSSTPGNGSLPSQAARAQPQRGVARETRQTASEQQQAIQLGRRARRHSTATAAPASP